jgi:glyoxylase-like metal-dependent hydrolase (beta-lactamase superfamily II)
MQHADGIHVVDTQLLRSGFDAAYLVVENGRAAFIDCGTALACGQMLAALDVAGLTPADVDWLIVTHVHLDHAGGAGTLLQQLPHARLVVHPRGAPHMMDPSRLVAGATAVYGAEEMARSHGTVLPVDPARIDIAVDGHVVNLAGRELLCIDTPGHARHHLCVWDARSRSWFTGDTFGISYRELDTAGGPFVFPSSSPVQFEPEALAASIRRMMQFPAESVYLTHYGRVGDVVRLADELLQQIAQMVAIAQECAAAADRHQALSAALTRLYVDRARAHGVGLSGAQLLDVLATDIELNAQGLACWLDRPQR